MNFAVGITDNISSNTQCSSTVAKKEYFQSFRHFAASWNKFLASTSPVSNGREKECIAIWHKSVSVSLSPLISFRLGIPNEKNAQRRVWWRNGIRKSWGRYQGSREEFRGVKTEKDGTAADLGAWLDLEKSPSFQEETSGTASQTSTVLGNNVFPSGEGVTKHTTSVLRN